MIEINRVFISVSVYFVIFLLLTNLFPQSWTVVNTIAYISLGLAIFIATVGLCSLTNCEKWVNILMVA